MLWNEFYNYKPRVKIKFVYFDNEPRFCVDVCLWNQTNTFNPVQTDFVQKGTYIYFVFTSNVLKHQIKYSCLLKHDGN